MGEIKQSYKSYFVSSEAGNDCIIGTYVYRGYEYEVITSSRAENAEEQHRKQKLAIDNLIGKEK